MKIAAINNNATKKAGDNNKNTVQYQPNFKGLDTAAALARFWQAVDNGGKAIQFTVEDMCSTNIERTSVGIYNDLKTYRRRKKAYEEMRKNGTLKPGQEPPKLFRLSSFPSTLQEGVREFLTGPIMTFAPMGILAGCKKAMGKTANTHLENIYNISDLMKKVPANKLKDGNLSPAFFEEAIKDMLASTLNEKGDNVEISKQEIEALKNSLENYYKIFSNKKTNKKQTKEALGAVQDAFSRIIKDNKANYGNTTFLNVKYSLPHGKTGSTSFKNYVDYLCSYVSDFSKKGFKEITEKTIDTFRNGWVSKRIATNVAMFGLTAIAMSKVPEWYTKLSGNINPNGIDVYEQAHEIHGSRNEKEVK